MDCPVLKSVNDAMNEKFNSIIITRITIIKEETYMLDLKPAIRNPM